MGRGISVTSETERVFGSVTNFAFEACDSDCCAPAAQRGRAHAGANAHRTSGRQEGASQAAEYPNERTP